MNCGYSDGDSILNITTELYSDNCSLPLSIKYRINSTIVCRLAFKNDSCAIIDSLISSIMNNNQLRVCRSSAVIIPILRFEQSSNIYVFIHWDILNSSMIVNHQLSVYHWIFCIEWTARSDRHLSTQILHHQHYLWSTMYYKSIRILDFYRYQTKTEQSREENGALYQKHIDLSKRICKCRVNVYMKLAYYRDSDCIIE